MANNSIQESDFADLRKKVEWLDSQRRQLSRKISELEQKTELQEREISGRERRILDLERQLAASASQLSRIPQVDTQLSQFKDEIVQLIEQYDVRRVQSETEMDRLRRVEHESTVREIADMRKEFPAITRLQNDMTLRVAEESRLANLIGSLQNAISVLEHQVENLQSPITFVEEKEKQNSRNISSLQNSLVDINKRWEPINERLDVMANNVRRVQSSNENVMKEIEEIRSATKTWMEQIQIGEYERNQRLGKWRQVLEDHTNAIDKFNQDWITFSDQYKEAKMAVQTLTGWQKQIEEQQREASEVLRVNTHRLEARWDDFKLESDKKWSTSNVEAEQRAATINRNYRQLQEQIAAIEGMIANLTLEKDTLERIQTAQADAIKQWPRLWLEEVEKAINQNPNRRRQPALVPVREEFD
jgi:chromosome segregation ATPase